MDNQQQNEWSEALEQAKPETSSEKLGLAAEKTQSAVEAFVARIKTKFNNIQSEKAKTAVLWGSGAVLVVLVAFVGFMVGRLIYGYYIDLRNEQTQATLADLKQRANDLSVSDSEYIEEENSAFLDEVNDFLEKLQKRNDENVWQAQSLKSGAEFQLDDYDSSVATLWETAETAPDIELLSIYQRIFFIHSFNDNKEGMISAIEAMFEKDVFSNSKDPMAGVTKERYENQLEELKKEVQK
jgi:predicted MPP superfamily phosphohydrolase